ncbi:MAG: hypothetical protein DRN81_00525, partial [Thermoproteota archaeon]
MKKRKLASILLLSLLILLVRIPKVEAFPRLTDFPAPFVQDGKIDYDLDGENEIAIILGETAAASDVLGAGMIGLKIGSHLYISHAAYPPEPFQLHKVDLNITLYEYDYIDRYLEYAPVIDFTDYYASWGGSYPPPAFELNSTFYLPSIYREPGWTIWVNEYGVTPVDPCLCPIPYIEYFTYRLGCRTYYTYSCSDWFVPEYYFYLYREWSCGSWRPNHYHYNVGHHKVSFEFNMGEQIFIVNEPVEIPWAWGVTLEVTGIHVASWDFTNLTSRNHTVAFALKDSAGNIIDCWIQNISTIYNVTFTYLSSCAFPFSSLLHIHVSKVCPDSSCAYVEVWSAPFPKHVVVYHVDDKDIIQACDETPMAGHDEYDYVDLSANLLWWYTIPPDWLCGGDIARIDTFVKASSPDRYMTYRWVWISPYNLKVVYPDFPCFYIKNMTWDIWLENETKIIAGEKYAFKKFTWVDKYGNVHNMTKAIYRVRTVDLPWMFIAKMDIYQVDFYWDSNLWDNILYLEDYLMVTEYFELSSIIGADVTGVFGGIFDRFIESEEYTGTTKYDMTTMQDITPAEEKDSIFDGEDVFSYVKAPAFYIAGSPDAERAKSEKHLILIGGPLANSYVKELNDTGLLPISF